jgi:hypothetical protein
MADIKDPQLLSPTPPTSTPSPTGTVLISHSHNDATSTIATIQPTSSDLSRDNIQTGSGSLEKTTAPGVRATFAAGDRSTMTSSLAEAPPPAYPGYVA